MVTTATSAVSKKECVGVSSASPANTTNTINKPTYAEICVSTLSNLTMITNQNKKNSSSTGTKTNNNNNNTVAENNTDDKSLNKFALLSSATLDFNADEEEENVVVDAAAAAAITIMQKTKTKKEGEDQEAEEDAEEWQTVERRGNRKSNNSNNNNNKQMYNHSKEERDETFQFLEQRCFELGNNEAPFLVGVKGRNISIIRKYTGVSINIRDNVVYVTPQRQRSDVELARRMSISACCGGVLRWFVTPAATKKGFPEHCEAELRALAYKHQCALELLRSRRGHMCLMLIPDPSSLLTNEDAEDHFSTEHLRSLVYSARVVLLEALSSTASTTANGDEPTDKTHTKEVVAEEVFMPTAQTAGCLPCEQSSSPSTVIVC